MVGIDSGSYWKCLEELDIVYRQYIDGLVDLEGRCEVIGIGEGDLPMLEVLGRGYELGSTAFGGTNAKSRPTNDKKLSFPC